MTTVKMNKFWDGLEVDYTGFEEFEEKLQPSCKTVIDALTEHPSGLTEGQIRDKCTGTTQLLHDALKVLLAAEKIYRKGKGVRGNPYIYRVKNNG